MKQIQHKPIVYIIGLIAALAGLLFGIDIGVISGALDYLRQDLHLTTNQMENLTSSILIGAVLGAVISGWINRQFGRRFAILVSAAVFVIGSVTCAFVSTYHTLYFVRIVLGLALGVASFSAPLYLSEIAPADIRGRLISGYQLMITIGIVLAYLSDTWFTQLQVQGLLSIGHAWRWMLGVVAIPSFLMFVVVLFLPNSPRWTALKGFDTETRSILNRLRHPFQVEPEFKEIKSSVNTRHPILELIKNPLFLKVIFLGVMLQIIQQLSGMNAILYYAPYIFKQAGYGAVDQMWITVSIGLVNVFATFFALYFIEKMGRRSLLYVGGIILFISTFFLSILFHSGFSTTHPMLPILLTFLFIIGFAISYGPVVWTLCSEIYPLRGREFGITCSTAANWIGNSLIASYSLSILNRSTSAFFLILAVIAVLSCIFFRLFVPETKGASLEQIEKNVWAGKSLNEIGNV